MGVPNRVDVLRIVVPVALLAAAIVFGTLSYFTLASYETDSANGTFRNTADYAGDTLSSDFVLMENAIIAMAKNMAYVQPNATEWPNVLVPGFYDVAEAQRDSVGLSDVFFQPIVYPEKLDSFLDFMYEYYRTEPLLNTTETANFLGRGLLGFYPNSSVYVDTTGETLSYYSPNKILTPFLQILFNRYLNIQTSLGVNMHSYDVFGEAMDALLRCSKRAAGNYSQATNECTDMTNIDFMPIGAPLEYVTDYHSAFLHPIYLAQNTSQVVGFMGGGFNWIEVFSTIFSISEEGIDIVLSTIGTTITFNTHNSKVRFKSYEDSHDARYNDLEKTVRLIPRDDGTYGYTVSMYPTDHFYMHNKTNNPIFGAVAAAVLLGLCAATFFLYDYYMRKSKAANEAVLETKRRFVRFISHEIRTPLNAVHLGLEALTEEVRRSLELSGNMSGCSALRESLRSWLELSTEMMANSDSAEEVLNDLLNYDKIEIGTLYLDFSSVPIWNIIETGVVVSLEQFRQKNIRLTLQNRLFHADSDVEQQNNHRFVVVGDAARLAQVMRTLLSNALKFTPKDGSISVHVDRIEGGIPHPNLVLPAKTVLLLQQPRAGSIRIAVTDSGANLSEAELAKISAEGVQFNANELQAGKGSGLGLFITKGIVEQHGGKLTVSSMGMGTTFTVELPLFYLPKSDTLAVPAVKHPEEEQSSLSTLARAANNLFHKNHDHHQQARKILPDAATDAMSPVSKKIEKAETQEAVDTQSSATNSATFTAEPSTPEPHDAAPPMYLLIVDDAQSNRKMINRILTNKGYTCRQAEDGQQAIELFLACEQTKPFCAITMDFEMPVMNGPTATKRLRELGCKVPIIGVTGNVLPDDIKYFKAQGATEVLGKPLNVNKFEEAMRLYENKI